MKHCTLTLLLTWSTAALTLLAGEKPPGRPSCKYDFGRAETPPAKGYVRVGVGDTYTAARGYGLIHSASARERGWRTRGIQADRRLDTFVFDDGGLTFIRDLPNGDCLVSLASGDAQYDGKASIRINGTEVAPLTKTRPNEFVVLESYRVKVTDGQLKVAIGGLGRLNYLEVTRADAAVGAGRGSGRVRVVRTSRAAGIEDILPKSEYAVGRDPFGPVVRVNLDRIKDWTRVPGIKMRWDVRGPNGEEAALHAIRSEIRDVDGDGKLDLFRLIHGSPYGLLARFDHTGRMVWQSEKLPPATGDESGLPVDDLDRDGKHECVLSQRGMVVCINAEDGTVKWKAPTGPAGREKDASMAIGHFADKKQRGVVVRAGMTVYCFDAQGKPLWTHPLDPKRYHWYGHELHPHDVNGDGYDEIFIGLNHTTLALTHDGKILWEDRTQRNHTDFFQFGDVDGDGRIEVVYDHDGCGGKGPILVADAVTGKRELAIEYRPLGLSHAQCLAVDDFRPDLPGLEIACTDKSRMIAAWDARGRLLWKRDTPTSLVTRADWDGDGVLDLVVFTVGKQVDPAFSVWNGRGERLYAISWLPSPLRSFTAVGGREEAQHVQADLDGNGRADVLVAFGPWAFGTPQNLVLMEAPARGAK